MLCAWHRRYGGAGVTEMADLGGKDSYNKNGDYKPVQYAPTDGRSPAIAPI